MSERTLISIVVPAYNEAANLPKVHEQIRDLFKTLPRYRYELIFVDDGSGDSTLSTMRKLADGDNQVKVVELVRNFGKEIAITAGLHHAKGEAAIMLDADLQHPIDRIPDFLNKWEQEADVVVGVRIPTKHHSNFMKRAGSRWFYRIMALISDITITPNATDYRLIDRVVIEEFNRFTERNRMTRGLIDWLGFPHAYVYFHPAKRAHGTATYGYLKLIGLAINSIVSMSFFPLRLAGYLGAIITLVFGTLGVFIFIENYVLADPLQLHPSGTAILGVLVVFLIGIVLASLGLIALYIANIHGEVVNRPLYVERHVRPKR